MKEIVQNRRQFLKTAALSTAVTGLVSYSGKAQAQSRKTSKPNLLVIMTDQQRFDTLSCAGNKILDTPNMDRIAREGVWFENTYTQCAVCSPARASMLTGYSTANHGIISNKLAYLPESANLMPMKTYDEILYENGYECEYYGKWHTPTFRARIYRNSVGMAGIHKTELGPGMKELYMRWLNPLYPDRPLKEGELKDTFTDRPYRPYPLDKRYDLMKNGEDYNIRVGQADIHGVTQIPSRYYLPTFEAGGAIEALERLKDQPFSITCSFHHPHPPYLATEKYIKMYPSEKMIPPASIHDGMPDSPYLNSKKNTPAGYSDPAKIKTFISEYYALIKEIDDQVGQLLDKLDELGLTDNTMVVFVSDHGEMLGDHGMKGKFCFYEGSSHVPMMIRFPGSIKAGTRVASPVSNMNLFATILDYMGIRQHPSDSISLRGLIEGTADKDTCVVTEWLSSLSSKPSHMILKGGWKFMRPDPSATGVKKALYNLNDDPHEMNNLLASRTDSKKYADKVSELESCFQNWMKRTSQSKQ